MTQRETWDWYDPFFDVGFWNDTAKEFSERLIKAGETIGETVGATVAPAAKAVTAPILGVAVIGLGVAAFVFRDEIKAALK